MRIEEKRSFPTIVNGLLTWLAGAGKCVVGGLGELSLMSSACVSLCCITSSMYASGCSPLAFCITSTMHASGCSPLAFCITSTMYAAYAALVMQMHSAGQDKIESA